MVVLELVVLRELVDLAKEEDSVRVVLELVVEDCVDFPEPSGIRDFVLLL